MKTMRLKSGKMIEGLYDLCKSIDNYTDIPLTIVELGCYKGESTMVFLQLLNIEKLHSVDMWTKNHNYRHEDISNAEKHFKNLFGNIENLEIHKTDSRNERFKDFKVDVVYIDADHRYESVKADILFWKDKTKIIAGHDYGMPRQEGVKKAVNEILGKPDKTFKDTSWIFYTF